MKPLTPRRPSFHRGGHLLRAAFLCIGTILLAGCGDDSNTATPRRAAMAHAKAMLSGNVAEAKALSVGDERSGRWLEAQIQELAAVRAYHDAMKQQFGEKAGGLSAQSAARREAKEAEMLAAIEKGRETIEGDTATITTGGNRVVNLKRVNGQWKVDRGRMGGDESVDAFVSRARRTAKAYQDVAASVRKGDYKAAADAERAVADRLVQAIEVLSPPGP